MECAVGAAGQGEVLHEAPVGPAVVGPVQPAVVAEEQTVAVVGVDPERVVVEV